MLSIRPLAGLLALLFVSCTGSITFRSPVSYTLDLNAYSSRYAFLAVGTGTVNSVPCSQPTGDAYCDGLVPVGSDVAMRCNASNVCDPEPQPLVQDLGVQDFSELSSGRVSVLDHLELVRIDLAVDRNTSNVAIPPIEIRWGTESASSSQLDTTTQRLATLPMIAVGETGEIVVTLDDAGLSALTDYLHGTSQRVRFFLRSNVDVDPGQPIPSGQLDVTVGFVIRASGQLR